MYLQAFLEQSVPNPAQDQLVISYHLPANTQAATLVIRRMLDSKTVATVPLAVNAHEQTLQVSGYSAGLYLYTLTVDGVPAATRRLIVQ